MRVVAIDNLLTITFDCDDLYDLGYSDCIKEKRFLFFKNRQDKLFKGHRAKLKKLDERLLTTKIVEQHFLGKIKLLINFSNSNVPSDALDNAHNTLQRLYSYNEKIIDDIAFKDAAHSTLNREESIIGEIIKEYKSRNIPQLYLHPKHPEDAINILEETLGGLDLTAQENCDLQCFIQMETIGYHAILAQQGIIDEIQIGTVKTNVNNALTTILDDLNTYIHLNRGLFNAIFDPLCTISLKRSSSVEAKP